MDEAHERSLNTDILFGIFKQLLPDRSDLRLVITSATIDERKISTFFGNVQPFHISGRTYPVSVQYLSYIPDDYVETTVKQILNIHLNQDDGDILVFMTGQEDIDITCELLYEKVKLLGENRIKPLKILPIYSQLSPEAQKLIFKNYKARKIIIATNIAETSLTLFGVKYVIDTGLGKWKVYNPKIGMDSLQIFPISKQNADQRKGRAGRTQSGICYRLYTEHTINLIY